MKPMTLITVFLGTTGLIMAAATAFMGVATVKVFDLSENFGRLDERVQIIGEKVENLDAMKLEIETGFKNMNQRFDRIDLRIGQMETTPEKLLADQGIMLEKDMKPVFFGGHVYAVAQSEDAVIRLTKAGYERETLAGFLPAFLMVKDAIPAHQ